jgi:hypothetical protein
MRLLVVGAVGVVPGLMVAVAALVVLLMLPPADLVLRGAQVPHLLVAVAVRAVRAFLLRRVGRAVVEGQMAALAQLVQGVPQRIQVVAVEAAARATILSETHL